MINQRSQDFRSVKQVINKDAIFSEIQSILQCLQSIVSKLSESDSIPVPVCPEVPEVQDQLDMWWDSQDVQCPLSAYYVGKLTTTAMLLLRCLRLPSVKKPVFCNS